MNIVKVKYYSETTGEAGGREYSYYSVDPLNVGDIVKVPVKDHFGKGLVTAIDVPEAQIAAFKDAVKTIPAGSIIKPAAGVQESLAAVPQPADQIQGRFVVDEKASAEKGTLVGDVVPNLGPYGVQEGEIAEAAVKATEDIERLAAIEARDKDEPAPPCIDPKNIPDFGVPSVVAVVKVSTDDDLSVRRLYQEGLSLKAYADARVISNNADLKPAVDDLSIIAKLKKALTERRTEYVAPIKAKLDKVNAAFAELIAPFDDADKVTRKKVGDFQSAANKRAAEAKAIEDAKLEVAQREAAFNGTGETTVDLGTVQAPPPAPAVIRTESGTVSGRDNWKARVLDFKLLPDEYKLPNEQMLNALARSTKGTRPIPGVEFYNDRTVTVRTK